MVALVVVGMMAFADRQNSRYWRLDEREDRGHLNGVTGNRVDLGPTAEHWEDVLRVLGRATRRPVWQH
jgi:hypothetical protein